MDDLSLHILDIAENSLNAGATLVDIRINEQPQDNLLIIDIEDNGRGMDQASAKAAWDTGMTTKRGKRFGLGLPFLAEAAEAAGGEVTIESKPDEGTLVQVTMEYNHFDRKPLGDLVATFMVLAAGYPLADFLFTHSKSDREYTIATWEIKRDLGENTLSSARAISTLREALLRGETGL